MATHPCVIELLGGLRVRFGDGTVTRFRTQRTGTLLAYLAYHLDGRHAREELIDLLWPEADVESGRMSLRTSLSSLRRQLEPPGVPPGSVVVSDRSFVGLNAAVVSTDVQAIDAAISAAQRAPGDSPGEQASHLERAVARYQGPLLPGVYDDWAVRERERLQMRHHAVLLELSAALERAGEWSRALDYAHRALALEPLAEEATCALMRLYAATGQPAAVSRQYRELARLLRRELGAEPSRAVRDLHSHLMAAFRPGPVSRPACIPVPCADPPPAAEQALVDQPPAGGRASQAPRLPVYLTPFFGRESDIARVGALLRCHDTRLVTVTGPGGSGKTRLAVQTARALADEFDGSVWFVPLADIADPALILDTVVRTLGLPTDPERSPLEVLGGALESRRSLLVLDNFEQLADEGALVVGDLLRQCPRLSALVTSRQRLEIGGEREFPLPPLPVPDMPGTPERLSQYASVSLFVDRAQAVRPDFQLTVANAPAIAALCERLEGIPLALELAAAWAQVLTPGRMLARLAERDDILTSPSRHAPARHRTMRATCDWSYRLLPPALQQLLARLSVFRGGWTLEAASLVCAGPLAASGHAREPDMLAQMRALVARSLVLCEDAGDDIRYRMLETLREYAGEQLPSEERRLVEQCHTSYFVRLAEEAEPVLEGSGHAAWLARLEPDLDNFRAVLERAQNEGDVNTGLRMATALARHWQARGSGDEGLRWLQGLLAQPAEVPPALRARALAELGGLLYCRRLDAGMLEVLHESLRIYTDLDDRRAMAAVLRRLSSAIHDITRDESAADPLLERSLALCEETGDVRGTAESLRCMGSAARDRSQYDAARSLYERSLSLYRDMDDLQGTAAVLAEMGYMLQEQEQYDRAEPLLRENLELSRRVGNKVSIGHALWLLGRLAQDRGDFPEAASLLHQGLELARQTGNRQQVVNCLVNLGLLSTQQGDHRAARRWYADSLAVAREIGNRPGLVLPLRLDAHCAFECGEHEAAVARYRECLRILCGRSAPAPTVYCLEGLARVHAAGAGAEQAARLYGAAEALRQAFPDSAPPADLAQRERALADLRGALGGQSFARAWGEGQALSLDKAIEMALGSD